MSNPAKPVLRTLLGLKAPGQPSKIIVWDTEEVSIGRAPENDLVVDDEEASREHAVLQRRLEGHFVRDLGTANGTIVNGAPLREEKQLAVKDVITIGATQITFITTQKDPAASGMTVVHASELKTFKPAVSASNPEATTLALGEMPGDDLAAGDFSVESVGSYGLAEPRDLDAELAGAQVSLTFEIGGLTPDLQRLVAALAGKVISLPALKIKVK